MQAARANVGWSRRVASIAVLLTMQALSISTASAQMPASALGQPLPDGKLAPGTVTVRVFDGSPQNPVDGLVVTLNPPAEDDQASRTVRTARTARTGKEGRATFSGLPVGSQWVAHVEYKEQTAESAPIEVPSSGGLRLLLSPTPWTAPPPAAARGAASRGRPAPSVMASQPRPERTVAPGTIRVRVLRGSWEKPAVGNVVQLVGLRADGTFLSQVGTTNAIGRVSFEGLRGSDVTYYVLATLASPRGSERLMSLPIQLPPRVGIALVLSGAAPSAGADKSDKSDKSALADDLSRLYREQLAPPDGPGTGQIIVRLGGSDRLTARVTEVELIEVGKDEPIAHAKAKNSKPFVQGSFLIEGRENEGTPAGAVLIGVLRAVKGRPPVAGVRVELMPTGASSPIVRTTDDRGVAEYPGLQIGTEYTPTVVMYDHRIEGKSFILSKDAGMLAAATLNWESNVKQAEFSALPSGKAYAVRARIGSAVHRSPPFQLLENAGAIIPLPIAGPPEFRFHLGGFINDKFMQFQGTFALTNGPVAPYSLGEDVFIPLPRGFVAARLDEEDSARVKVQPGKGLLWKGAIPAGGLQFNLAFTMNIEDGTVAFDWDLPRGARGGTIAFDWLDTMSVDVVGKAAGKKETRGDRKIYTIRDINIEPGRRISMRIHGLPQMPGWYRWVRLLVGFIAVVLIAVAILVLFLRTGGQESMEARRAEQQRDSLLEELTQLERRNDSGDIAGRAYKKRRERLLKQLEPFYSTASKKSAGSSWKGKSSRKTSRGAG